MSENLVYPTRFDDDVGSERPLLTTTKSHPQLKSSAPRSIRLSVSSTLADDIKLDVQRAKATKSELMELVWKAGIEEDDERKASRCRRELR
ncbi:hypothetical protein ACRE_063870 [Hapsidospora chrysogenum ATCC 11550]|uniref:Uncharacterized protein n=1 Tax=Hapsidospora chrysogenum (strain ATCC 11550 / CBS 779.69 / DSM 880 / IAM 14645 / JCM 23072 / IMI 49137) TaxID=857340 RepID=A0A086T0L0_HAPC1|nr:hypothetical protein ACRE_063870 [Hapsidospora chrysogenum ATCC 11550]